MRTKTGAKTILFSLVIAVSLVAVSGTAFGTGANETTAEGAHNDPYESNDPLSSGPRLGDSCQQKAENAYMFGVFSTTESSVEGRFVSFSYSDGALFEYTVIDDTTIPVFGSIKIDDFQKSSEPKTDGAIFIMDGENTRVMAHNNPTGMLQITSSKQSGSVNVNLELAPGLDLEKVTNGTFSINGLAKEAFLRIGGADLSVEGSVVHVEIGNNGHVMFSMLSEKGYGSYEYRHSYTMALMNGSIDSELNVVTSNGMSLVQKFEYEGKVQMHVKALNKNKICVMVESQEHKGKVVSIGVDKETMGNANKDQVMVKLDGKELRKAQNMEQVLSADSDTEGLYWVEESQEGLQGLVYIPHFSEHELVIEKISGTPELGSPILVGLISACILAVLVTLVIVVEKRRTGRNR